MELSLIQFGLKEAAEHSNRLIEWSLLLYAGSVATIVSTSYIRPPTKKFRLIYLSFLPAWVLLAISIYYGRQINGRYLASVFAKPEFHSSIRMEMMGELQNQINLLQLGMLFLGCWLILYVLWWIFGEWNDPKKEYKSMPKRIILILLCLSISTSISYSADCTKKDCLNVPWPKECDKFCASTAIENSSYSQLINLFKFTPDLASKIMHAKEDKRLTGINIIEKLEGKLSPEDLKNVFNTIDSLSSQDQNEIIRRGLINKRR